MTILSKKEKNEIMESTLKTMDKYSRLMIAVIDSFIITPLAFQLLEKNPWSLNTFMNLIMLWYCGIIAGVIAYLIFDYFISKIIDSIQSEKVENEIVEKFHLIANEYVKIQKVDCKENELLKFYAKLILDNEKMYVEIWLKSSENEMTFLTKMDNFDTFSEYYIPEQFREE